MNDLDIPGLHPVDAVIAAEMAVLGAAIESRAAAEAMAEVVTSRDFWKSKHQAVAESVERLVESGRPVNPTSVLADLTVAGTVTQVGAGPGLMALLERRTSGLRHDAELIARDAVRRRVLEALASAQQMAASPGFNPDADVDAIRQRLDGAASAYDGDRLPTIGELLIKRLDELEKPLTAEDSVPPPWIDLEMLVTGLRPGQVVVIGARPAIGKSVVGLGFARHAAVRLGLPTLLFSLEMTAAEVTDRLIAAEAGVSLRELQRHALGEDDWRRIARVSERVQEAPLVVDDNPRCTLARIRARLRGMTRRDRARLVVVDYVGLMDAPRADSRERQVAELSRGLKLLATEFGVPIVALHQLNRESMKRSDRRPTMSDLRESGAIEADADLIILLHREDAYDKESPRSGEMDLIVDKNRNGPTTSITVAFQGHYARAVDMAPEPSRYVTPLRGAAR